MYSSSSQERNVKGILAFRRTCFSPRIFFPGLSSSSFSPGRSLEMFPDLRRGLFLLDIGAVDERV